MLHQRGQWQTKKNRAHIIKQIKVFIRTDSLTKQTIPSFYQSLSYLLKPTLWGLNMVLIVIPMGCFLSSVPLSAVWSVIFTVDPTEAGRTGTGIAVDAVSTVGSVLARVALTLIYVLLALCAPKAGQTGTQEAMHLVTTEASVAARVCWGEGTEHDTQLVFFKPLLKTTLRFSTVH